MTLLLTTPLAALAQEAQSIVDSRQTTFEKAEQLIEQSEDLIDNATPDWEQLELVTGKLVSTGNILSQSFPKGSHHSSRAKLNIWQQPAKFNSLFKKMNDGYLMMQTGVENQDIKQINNGIKQAQKTCKSCHRSYRSFW